MENLMMNAMVTMLTAIFFEVLPEAMQELIKENQYKLYFEDGNICIERKVMCQYMLDIYKGEDEFFVFEDGYYMPRDNEKSRRKYEELFADIELKGVYMKPERLLVYDESLSDEMVVEDAWLNAYVKYCVSLDTIDITGAIRAAKKFAELE